MFSFSVQVGDGGIYTGFHFSYIYTTGESSIPIICPQQQELIIEARQICSQFLSDGWRRVGVSVSVRASEESVYFSIGSVK